MVVRPRQNAESIPILWRGGLCGPNSPGLMTFICAGHVQATLLGYIISIHAARYLLACHFLFRTWGKGQSVPTVPRLSVIPYSTLVPTVLP